MVKSVPVLISAIVMESTRAQGAKQHAPLSTIYQVDGGPLPTSLEKFNLRAIVRALLRGVTKGGIVPNQGQKTYRPRGTSTHP